MRTRSSFRPSSVAFSAVVPFLLRWWWLCSDHAAVMAWTGSPLRWGVHRNADRHCHQHNHHQQQWRRTTRVIRQESLSKTTAAEETASLRFAGVVDGPNPDDALRLKRTSLQLNDQQPAVPTNGLPVHQQIEQTPPNILQCQFCQSTDFASRNAVFRHLHSGDCPNAPLAMQRARTERVTVALFLGYQSVSPTLVNAMVLESLDSVFLQNSAATAIAKVMGSTQSTLAKSRPLCLGPEQRARSGSSIADDVDDDNVAAAAAEDVLIVNIQAPLGVYRSSTAAETILDDDTTSENGSSSENNLATLGRDLATELQKRHQRLQVVGDSQSSSSNNSLNGSIRLHGLRFVEASKNSLLHAEQSCTQHIYHYLLPASWLPDSESIVQWYQANVHKPRFERRGNVPSSIHRFKSVLRSMESPVADVRQHARFGGLGLREKRPWHNFANPALRLPPNYDPVHRVVDRARLIDFVSYPKKDTTINNSSISFISSDANDKVEEKVYVVCAIAGDEFLQQQVCRMIGTAVAVTHGWLPPDFIPRALQRDSLVETILAPNWLSYKAASRFHYEEIRLRGKPLCEADGILKFHHSSDEHGNDVVAIDSDGTATDPVDWIQSQLLSRASSNGQASVDWLMHTRDTVAPRISAQLLSSSFSSHTSTQRTDVDGNLGLSMGAAEVDAKALLPAPDVYLRVLDLLREMVATRQWPATSMARSQVIGALETDRPVGSSGSFTVVAQDAFECTNDMDFSLPHANSLFPELAAAVFELERSLIWNSTNSSSSIRTTLGNEGCDDNASPMMPYNKRHQRLPSSHCAINSNAQFTPHVDSGRGAGQSVSMIVGLGDYAGGDIRIEKGSHDIRYRPVQFDGWKLRHWTQPFQGERFSLVWFTPEGMIPKTRVQ